MSAAAQSKYDRVIDNHPSWKAASRPDLRMLLSSLDQHRADTTKIFGIQHAWRNQPTVFKLVAHAYPELYDIIDEPRPGETRQQQADRLEAAPARKAG